MPKVYKNGFQRAKVNISFIVELLAINWFKCIIILVQALLSVLAIRRDWINGVTKPMHVKAILVVHWSENILKLGNKKLWDLISRDHRILNIPAKSWLRTCRPRVLGIWLCSNIWSFYSSWNLWKLASAVKSKTWSMWLTQRLHRIVCDALLIKPYDLYHMSNVS